MFYRKRFEYTLSGQSNDFCIFKYQEILRQKKKIICIFIKLMPDNSNFIREANCKTILKSITGFYCIFYSI